MGELPSSWDEPVEARPVPTPSVEALDELLRPPPRPSWTERLRSVRTGTGVGWRPVAAAAAVVLVAALVVAGALGMGGGGAASVVLPRATSGSVPPAVSDGAAVPSTSTVAPTPAEATVHVAGAVASPGVVRVAGGARWADALAAVGGASPDADLDRVNLAAPVSDGARLFVPRRGADPPAMVVVEGPTGAGATASGERAGAAPAAPVDLNSATTEQLDTLPGVGPATAAAILEHRTRNGPFRSTAELQEVPGIGPARYERLAPLVAVGP